MKLIQNQLVLLLISSLLLSSCATGRDLTSNHYIPEWENKIINLPNPSETSSGYWLVRGTQKAGYYLGRTLLIPFAVAGNMLVNAYYIATWPIRWPLRGDKRLIVWYPLFKVGDEVASDFYSKEWNRDLK